ncbi:MAG: endopeptidase La [Bacilli bacterium]|nr:endopeptidase La [Bacilli bacterium]
MIKTNLPVIILKGIVLLPHCDLRVEFASNADKNILLNSEDHSDNHVMVVTQTDTLEESIQIRDLPKVGVVAKIKNKITLANGHVRIILSGLHRAEVHNYIKYGDEADSLESVIGPVTNFEIDEKEEFALVRRLLKELELLISKAPYISNSILSELSGITDINVISDIVCQFLPTPVSRKIEYVDMLNPTIRVKMLLQDIKDELEIIKLENKLDNDLRQNLEDTQKEYFLREKIRIIKEELGDVNSKEDEIEKLRNKVKTLKCSYKITEKLNNEINRYEMMTPNSPEYSMLKGYIDTLLSLPWGIYTKDNKNLNKSKQILDNTHYGLEKIKERIVEFLAVKQMSKNSSSPILCFVGPPGTGKTSLAFSIAKSLNRNFVKISVGGINDEAEIMGHRRTYIGSSPGKIIQSIKKSKSFNPVFLIDEVDKMTKDIKGDPASALLEVLDKEQNKYFVDNYIEEEVDLSDVVFILTANYLHQIPEPLKDRLEIIELSSYTEYEKLDIAKKYLIPKIIKEHGINKNNIFIPDKTILTIIRNYTKEAGVRELERLISTIIRKVVKSIVMTGDKNVLYKIYDNTLEKYLGLKKYFYTEKSSNNEVGVVNGLAYTSFGGDILPIEVIYYKGSGKLNLTGSLGDVMKESASIALSYIKSNAKLFKIKEDLFENIDIHIHVPEGAIPKDGPSAGIALTSALISALTKKFVDNKIAMTGEITLRGKILPIGGLKEKVIGANRSGVKTVILPYENEKDIINIPKEINDKMKYIFVRNYNEVYNYLYNRREYDKEKK